MARPGDIDHRQVMRLDDPIEMHIEEIEPWRRAPMPEQAWLDVLEFERLLEQWIVEQINLADR